MNRTLLFTVATLLLLIGLTPQAGSIPAFARKYKTSCATCHNGFPKLTAFGEAFRRNGYQFPGGTDAEFTKEEPVSLGAEGNKKAFPDAIWPGSLPGTSPVSFFLNGEIDYNPRTDPQDVAATQERWSFGGLGNSIETVAAGTVGEDISFWGQAAFGADGLEVNRIFLTFSNIVGSSYALNLRVGVFEPGLFSFSTHRSWMEGYWLTTRPFSGDMAWSIEETQKGLEVNGMAGGRFGYNAGVVESFGISHSDKDVYGHVTYKFGGLPLDGVVEGGGAPNNAKPYMDNSLTLGAFVYSGSATLGPDPLVADDKFTMAGGDFNGWYDRFNLFGGIGVRHDDQPFLESAGVPANSTVWFAELDMVVFPWLLPGIRYESWNGQALDPLDPTKTVSFTDSQITPGIVFLIRPNVKAVVKASFAKLFASGDSGMHPGQVAFMLALGI